MRESSTGGGGPLTDTVPPALAALVTAIDELELSLDGHLLAAVLAAQDRLAAKVSTTIGEFDRAGLWELDGATSMRAWLEDRGWLTRAEAARSASAARRLLGWSRVRAAWVSGRLSGGHVAVIAANVTARTAALFEQHEEAVVDAISGLPVADAAVVLRDWAARADALVDEDEAPEPPTSSLHHSVTLDGRSVLSGSFDALGAVTIERALEAAMAPYRSDDPTTLAQRRAASLLDVARFYLDRHLAPSGRRNRPHLDVVVTLEDLRHGGTGRTADGVVLDSSVVRMLSCDATVHRVLVDQRGAVLDYGRGTRTVSADLFAALSIRDGGCRWPGCGRLPRHTEAHHIVWWEHGGTTSLDNLVLLCSKHHHLLHKGQWNLVLRPEDHSVVVTAPGRAARRSEPPRRGPPPLSDRLAATA